MDDKEHDKNFAISHNDIDMSWACNFSVIK